MLPITRQMSAYNHSAPNNIQYLVIHGTGSTATDTAKANADYFCACYRGASAHLFVDNTSIYQIIEFSEASFHCGDGNMAYGIGNHNSIGIEMCHTNGTVSETTENNTVELVKYLMDKFNIDINHVVRHYDASRKNCPAAFSANNWERWFNFKAKLSNSPSTTTEIYRVRSAYDNVSSQIGAFSDLEKAKALADAHPGYSVYDSKFNRVYPTESSSQTTIAPTQPVQPRKPMVVCYGNEIDKRAAEYIRDFYNCDIQDANKPFDYSIFDRVVACGGNPTEFNGQWSSFTTDFVKGENRYKTVMEALKFIGEL